MRMVPPGFRLREVIETSDHAPVAVGEGAGGTYLVIPVAGRSGPCWVCAPASERALACVRDGRSSAWAVVHHSATGAVVIYRTVVDGSVRESVVLCSGLPDGRALLAAA